MIKTKYHKVVNVGHKYLFFLFCILVITSCEDDNKLEFRINEKFAVYDALSCRCFQIFMNVDNNASIGFLKNVKEVRGNSSTFLVKTGPSNSAYETWILFKSKDVFDREDPILIENENIQNYLDTITIDFVKNFE